ncbi:MAG: hypothetical protein ABT940_12665 [Alphaproteobacteria bacterium]
MVRRVSYILAVALASFLLSPGAWALETYQALFPLMVDLPGWQAEKPDGMNLEAEGQKVFSTTRRYERGESHFSVVLLAGMAAAAQVAAAQSAGGINVETPEGRVSTEVMNGFQVTTTYSRTDRSGTVMVILGQTGLLSFEYGGLSSEEGLALARKFDWGALRKAVEGK